MLGCACASGDSSGAAPTAAANPRPVDRVLGPAPPSCGAPPLRRQLVSREFAPLLGARPAWFGPYLTVERRRARMRILRDAPRTRHGWRVKFLWVVDRRAARGTVTVRGADAKGRALYFELEDGRPGDTAKLDPAEGAGDLVDIPSYLHFPGAGCYTLEARWRGGRWRLRFAAGR